MLEERFNFKNLFVLDLANNHQGDIDHGMRIIKEHAAVIKKHGLYAGIKFQFRNLPDFIHVDEIAEPTNKHVPRFLETKLSWNEFSELVDEVKKQGLLAICTPFDEASVDKIVQLKFDVIKVASCSATDWPLLEKISSTAKPVIASTGGLTLSQVDDLVSFFDHRGVDFALMHCVSIYPTPDEACHLGNIQGFTKRYVNRVIGWSTHEPPSDTMQVGVALALGAEMFERHIGIATDAIKLNAYSSTPAQIDDWLNSYIRARTLIGDMERNIPLEIEKESIDGLRRGVFAKRKIESGSILSFDDIYFAFPLRDGQCSSGEWKSGMICDSSFDVDEPLIKSHLIYDQDNNEKILKESIHEVKAMLAHAKVPLSHEFNTEYSHHYGIENFRQVGVVLITVINREYAKKILVQLPGQSHPSHYHKLKEETFLIIAGELISILDGRERILKPGDALTVPPGVWHSFSTKTGCVFEEISTTAYRSDSIYRDPAINKLDVGARKTTVDHWGRFQLNEKLKSNRNNLN